MESSSSLIYSPHHAIPNLYKYLYAHFWDFSCDIFAKIKYSYFEYFEEFLKSVLFCFILNKNIELDHYNVG